MKKQGCIELHGVTGAGKQVLAVGCFYRVASRPETAVTASAANLHVVARRGDFAVFERVTLRTCSWRATVMRGRLVPSETRGPSQTWLVIAIHC